MLGQYVLAILGFSFIIMVHEFGHFVMAKLSGMHVEEFFLGFGPKLLKFKSRSGTLWGINAIPVGGYNKILGMEREAAIPEDLKHRSYSHKPYYKKFLVIIGGVLFNAVAAILMIMLFLSMGVYEANTTIDYIDPQAPAYQYGFEVGDKVIAIDGKPIDSWDEFSSSTQKHQGSDAIYTIVREEKQLDIAVVLEQKDEGYYLGIGPQVVKKNLSFLQVIKQSLNMVWDIIKTYVGLIGMLFKGQLSFNQARPVSPVGVISIFQQSAAMGMQNFILFIALISLIVGIGNLIPILPLDGGHVVILAIESIRRKPVPKKVLEVLNAIGIIMLVSLLVIGFVYDIISPFNIQNM